MHMVSHGSRNTDAARRALGLEPSGDIHSVPVKVGAIGYRVPKIDPNPESDCPIRRLIAIMTWHLLLHLDRATHRAVYAVEHDQQGVPASLDDFAPMLLDPRIDQVPAESTQSFERPLVIEPDQSAVADHIGVQDGDQLPPIFSPLGQV
jgi:hypothetical protein